MTLSVLWYSLVFLTIPSQLKLPSLLKNTRQPASAQLVQKQYSVKINQNRCYLPPLSWIDCGRLVNLIQDLQYLGQVVLAGREVWLWLRWSLVKGLPGITEPPVYSDVISGVLQDTLWASFQLQGVDVNLVNGCKDL